MHNTGTEASSVEHVKFFGSELVLYDVQMAVVIVALTTNLG